MNTGDLLPRRSGESPKAIVTRLATASPWNTPNVFSRMQRERRHIHENQRKPVEGSDHPVGACAFGQQHNSRAQKER
jgi:hypothetical protein